MFSALMQPLRLAAAASTAAPRMKTFKVYRWVSSRRLLNHHPSIRGRAHHDVRTTS